MATGEALARDVSDTTQPTVEEFVAWLDGRDLGTGAAVHTAGAPIAIDAMPWYLRVLQGDLGTSLLLNRIHLEPGEALYLAAGNLHAYLRGTAIEIMANSDNVLRGGLTPKHIEIGRAHV